MHADTSEVDPIDLNMARRNTIGDALTRVADRTPGNTAIVQGDRRFTYQQFEHDAEAVARGIIALDNSPAQGEPIAILMTNSYENLVTYFGIVKAGRVALPINFGLSADNIAWIIQDAQAKAAVCDEALLGLLESVVGEGAQLDTVIVNDIADAKAPSGDPGNTGAEARAGLQVPAGAARVELTDLIDTEVDGELRLLIGSDDVAQCLYTSGTTARPKGALASHSAVATAAITNALLMTDSWGREPGVVLICLPLFHVTALNTIAKPVLFTGGTLVIQQGFDPVAVIDAMESERVTMFTGLPMMWAALVQEYAKKPRDLSAMETAMYAMAQMPERVLAGMDEMMPEAKKVLGSGQTEVVPATTFQRPEHRHGKNGSWGMPSPTVRTRIMDPEGNLLGVGEEGEIVYRGPHVMQGYWNRPDANAEVFRDGWLHSGDIGYIDDEGVVWFTDRVKDIVKTGGENVSSMKVERVISDAPGVVECCVIGTSHPRWGEAVTAIVLSDKVPTRAEVSEDEYARIASEVEAGILAYAKEHLGGFEVPKRVDFIDELPKTATGKIRKNILREMY